jgi:hypothetical protein
MSPARQIYKITLGELILDMVHYLLIQVSRDYEVLFIVDDSLSVSRSLLDTWTGYG